MTCLDHITTISTITARAIIIPTPEKNITSKKQIRKSFEAFIDNIHRTKPNNALQDQLNEATQVWYKVIQETMENPIPKTKGKTKQSNTQNITHTKLQRI